jgi:hypothetical protein
MSSRTLAQGLLALLCGAVLASCAEPAPSNAEEAADDAGVTEPAPLDEPNPNAWAPYTVEEARALRDSFKWEDTVALPEEPLAERTPPELQQATDKSLASTLLSSLVSLHYVQIYIKDPDHLRELEEIGVHWDLAPLFESELPNQDYTYMSFEGDPQDSGGMFVYTFMPAVIYNAIRAAALVGEETYPAVILRDVPAEARAWDGTVKWEYLAGALLSYAPSHTHLTDLGETPFPSVLDDEVQVQDPTQPQQKRWGRRLRKWARKARDAVRTVVDTVRKGVGELAKWVRPTTKMQIVTRVKNHDSEFKSLVRAWDRYGSPKTVGNPLKLQNTRINVTQWGGLTLFPTKTNESGDITVSVPRDRKTKVCIEADSPAARMEAGLLWPVRACVDAGVVKGTTHGMGIEWLENEFAALAQLQDARSFSIRALDQTPSKATVQVGWPAGLITSINDGRAFVPCLEATNGPVSVANLLSDALEAIGVGNAIEFLIASDIILPTSARKDRVTPSHEYGHFVFCDLLNRENAQTFNWVWSAVIKDTLPKQKNTEVIQINEGFADWFASQVTGGVGYFELDGRNGRTSSNGRFFDFQSPGSGLGMEENVGTVPCGGRPGQPIAGDNIPRTWPACQVSAKLEGLDRGVATFATLLHDFIDRQSPGTELTGDAAVWRFTRTPNAPTVYVLQTGPWQATRDEDIEMPAKRLLGAIKDFANRNGAVGTRLTADALLHDISWRLMNHHNYSREQVCKAIMLHREGSTCPTSVVPEQAVVIQ